MNRQKELIHNQEERLLFLYVSPDGGHKVCADAVRNAFQSDINSQPETYGIDTFSSMYPFLGPIISNTYLEILKYSPKIWSVMYDNPVIEEFTRKLRQIFNVINTPKLKELLNEYNPTGFICTHAIPCGVLAELKKRGLFNLPLIGIVTDFDAHAYWIYPEVDLYLVSSENTKQALISRGIQQEKIKITGIPIYPSFAHKSPKQDARKKLFLETSKFTFLIMGGTKGLGPIEKIIDETLSVSPHGQILVVTGNNSFLKEKLSKFKSKPNIHIYGNVSNISELMDASDLLVSKPGGMTSSEALAKGLPMIMVQPIPGQEERNAKYLATKGAAANVKDFEEYKKLIHLFMNEPEFLESISQIALSISKPNAAIDSCNEILKLFSQEKMEPNSLKPSKEKLRPLETLSAN